jgi:hypothetical protein
VAAMKTPGTVAAAAVKTPGTEAVVMTAPWRDSPWGDGTRIPLVKVKITTVPEFLNNLWGLGIE